MIMLVAIAPFIQRITCIVTKIITVTLIYISRGLTYALKLIIRINFSFFKNRIVNVVPRAYLMLLPWMLYHANDLLSKISKIRISKCKIVRLIVRCVGNWTILRQKLKFIIIIFLIIASVEAWSMCTHLIDIMNIILQSVTLQLVDRAKHIYFSALKIVFSQRNDILTASKRFFFSQHPNRAKLIHYTFQASTIAISLLGNCIDACSMHTQQIAKLQYVLHIENFTTLLY